MVQRGLSLTVPSPEAGERIEYQRRIMTVRQLENGPARPSLTQYTSQCNRVIDASGKHRKPINAFHQNRKLGTLDKSK